MCSHWSKCFQVPDWYQAICYSQWAPRWNSSWVLKRCIYCNSPDNFTVISLAYSWPHMDGLVQDCNNSSLLAVGLHFSFINPLSNQMSLIQPYGDRHHLIWFTFVVLVQVYITLCIINIFSQHCADADSWNFLTSAPGGGLLISVCKYRELQEQIHILAISC